jgi:predicted Zn-dependent protease with MMP-like domain
MSPQEFDRLVEEACAKIPARFRKRLENVAFMVEQEPAPRHLAAAGISGGSLLGLYQGRPLPQRSVQDAFVLPDQIIIFQGPHERLARSLPQLRKLVEETVWHEVAHYFGLDERQVRSAEHRRRTRGRRSRPSRGARFC